MIFVAVMFGGGIGAALRFTADRLLRARTGLFPWPTLLVNVTGSFALGLLAGAVAVSSPVLLAFLGPGVLGGYTTFSTASVETLTLLRERAWLKAAGYAFGGLAASVAAAAAGWVAVGAPSL